MLFRSAAAQGLIAGLNAARQSLDQDPWSPRRDQAYMGVLIDDLITQGTREPYRMFTSRAEYRLHLREDNADLRLTEQGRQLGLVNDERWDAFQRQRDAITSEQERLGALLLVPGKGPAAALEQHTGIRLSREVRAIDALKRPELNYAALMEIEGLGPGVSDQRVAAQVETQAKYAGYLGRQAEEVAKSRRNEAREIPANFDYYEVKGLSAEAREKQIGRAHF